MALHPVGPLAPSTYWRRRAVLLGLLVVLVLVLRSCVGGDARTPAGRDGAGPSPSPSVSRTAVTSKAPTSSPSARRPGAPGTCTDSSLVLTSRTDAASYPAGVRPRITVTVTNRSGTTCRRDLGGRALEVRVYSGEDRIWSTDDCSPDTTSSVQTIAAGKSLETTVTWPRTRSARGCPTARPVAQPGTYVVRIRLGTLAGERTVFRLAA